MRLTGASPLVPVLCASALLAVGLLTAGATATEVQHFQASSREAFLEGELSGISVDPLGRLQLADRASRLTSLEEPFVFAAAPHPEGWVVGTGNAGRVLLVEHDGDVRTLFSAPESEIFAVLAEADGTVYAGTSPKGKVYRISPGANGSAPVAEPFFDPGETYIWALARAEDGALLIATGTEGKLYRVNAQGQGEVLFDSDDTHLRSLEVLPGGDLLLGTADEGLVLRLSAGSGAGSAAGAEVRTLFDADKPEVVALAAGANGDYYAAVVASEASFVDRSQPPNDKGANGAGGETGEPRAVVTVGEPSVVTPTAGSPRSGPGGRRGGKGARSELLRISSQGLVESVWAFEEETVYSLLWQRDRLWVGTGLEGKLYSWDGASMVLEKDVDERQIVSLSPDRPGPAFVTTNAAALYRMTGGTERSGTFTSPALDAGAVSRFGTLHWTGELPPGADLGFAFRSGFSSEPDRTWSAWSEPAASPPAASSPSGDSGEVSLRGVPPGRYVQWRARFQAPASGAAAASPGGVSPRLYGVELSYRQENLQPVIESLTTLEPGKVLVPASFNPANQVFEPAHPNRDGIFTRLGGEAPSSDARTKPLWKKGYRTLQWEASDPNEDELRYHLDFRPERPAASAGDEGWLRVAGDLEETYLSFDATVMPDGLYRFRLTASDEPGNPVAALVTTQISEPVLIDHTPPVLESVRREGDRLRVSVRDAASPLREAMLSLDAARWEAAVMEDGLTDGRSEVILIPIPSDSQPSDPHLLLLRLTDAAFNTITLDLTAELPAARNRAAARRRGSR